MKLAQAVAELNPLDDLGQPVPAVEVAPFALRGDHQLERHGEAGLNLAAINRRSRKASCAAWRQNVHSHAMLLRLLCCTAVSQIPARCEDDDRIDVPGPERTSNTLPVAAVQLLRSRRRGFTLCVAKSARRCFHVKWATWRSRVLKDREKLHEQLAEPIDDRVRAAYLLLAHAKMPDGFHIRPSGHGYIDRELRFELGDRWYFSAVLNKSWVLWYFRRPAFAGLTKDTEELLQIFPSAELTKKEEVSFAFAI